LTAAISKGKHTIGAYLSSGFSVFRGINFEAALLPLLYRK
jgi:hypothetical protein